jgi:glucokinase
MASQCAIGVDVGGTKCAAGLVLLPEGRVLARGLWLTEPGRGGRAVLDDLIEQARALQREATRFGVEPIALGLGVAELVGLDGRVLSSATIAWRDIAVGEEIHARMGLTVRIEADVRAAAWAESRLGAGRGLGSFLYATIGTGISACLVVNGAPYPGARGLTGTFASSCSLVPNEDGTLVDGPPLEQFAAGPALTERFAAVRDDRTYTPTEIVALCEAGDESAKLIVTSAGRAVGAAVAQLVNMLDPGAVVIGGGLGLAGGRYLESLKAALREHVWSEFHREIPLLPAALGVDAGLIGAAIAALENVAPRG